VVQKKTHDRYITAPPPATETRSRAARAPRPALIAADIRRQAKARSAGTTATSTQTGTMKRRVSGATIQRVQQQTDR
jgi:hypothetical protein